MCWVQQQHGGCKKWAAQQKAALGSAANCARIDLNSKMAWGVLRAQGEGEGPQWAVHSPGLRCTKACRPNLHGVRMACRGALGTLCSPAAQEAGHPAGATPPAAERGRLLPPAGQSRGQSDGPPGQQEGHGKGKGGREAGRRRRKHAALGLPVCRPCDRLHASCAALSCGALQTTISSHLRVHALLEIHNPLGQRVQRQPRVLAELWVACAGQQVQSAISS